MRWDKHLGTFAYDLYVHATIDNVSIYLYVTFALLATYTMGNWASIIRQMPDCPLSVTIYTSISQHISLHLSLLCLIQLLLSSFP
jgi:hypothetical protein